MSISGPERVSPGSSVVFEVRINPQEGLVSTIQFDITYDPSALSLTTEVGEASRASWKTIQSADVKPSQKRVLVSGVNRTLVTDGTVVRLFALLARECPEGEQALQLSAAAASDPDGRQIPVTVNGATVQVSTTGNGPERLVTAGVLNAASLRSGPVTLNEVVTFVGSAIGREPVVEQQTDMGETIVWVNDQRAEVLSEATNRVIARIPDDLAGAETAYIRIQRNEDSVLIDVPVAEAAPGLYTADGSGSGPALAYNEDLSANTPDSPAATASVLSVVTTGLGPLSRIADLKESSNAPLSISLGGASAEILDIAAVTEPFPGTVTLRFRVPEGVSGPAVPIRLEVGSFVAQAGVTVSVQ